MRITLVGPTFPYKGGIAQHTTELAKRLQRIGNDVRILTWSSQYPRFLYPGELEIDEAEGEPFERVDADLAWYDPVGWWRAGGRLAGPDHLVVLCVVNALQVPAYLTIARRATRAGATVALLCHNVVPHDSGRVQRWALTRLMSTVGRAQVHSQSEATAAREMGATDVAVAPLPHFFPVPIPRTRLPEVPHRRVLFFGFVRPYKGLDVLIDALALTSTDVALRVVGEFWDSPEETLKRVADLGLEGRVQLDAGYLQASELPEILEAVDALVVPYRSGTGSQHPSLAHLAGIPVIVTTAGDLSSRVRDGVDGYVVPAGDPRALAAALDRLYEPGELARLRSGIVGDPTDSGWADYVDSLTRLAEGPG